MQARVPARPKEIPTEVAGIIDYLRADSHGVQRRLQAMRAHKCDLVLCCNGGRVVRALVQQVRGGNVMPVGEADIVESIVSFCLASAEFQSLVRAFCGAKVDIIFRLDGGNLSGIPTVEEKL